MCGEKRDWQALCEAASKEHDPVKLMALVTELMKALDERKTRIKRSSDPSSDSAI